MTTLIKLGEVNRFCAVLISRLTGSKAVWTFTTAPRLPTCPTFNWCCPRSQNEIVWFDNGFGIKDVRKSNWSWFVLLMVLGVQFFSSEEAPYKQTFNINRMGQLKTEDWDVKSTQRMFRAPKIFANIYRRSALLMNLLSFFFNYEIF